MKIDFKGKESYNDILKKANTLEKQIEFNEKSFVVQGDNFIVMSSLLPVFKGTIDAVLR